MMELSLVIPCFEEKETLREGVFAKIRALDSLGIDYELIVVLDGPEGGAWPYLQQISHPRLKVIRLDRNHGKGYALRRGFESASGKLLGYIDADADIDPKVLCDMYRKITETGADVVYPNKFHPQSRCTISFPRRVLSQGYRRLILWLFDLNVKDTQTGAKMYDGPLLKRTLPYCKIDRFAFEAEIFLMMQALGHGNFQDVPVFINKSLTSSVKIGQVFDIFWNTLALYFRKQKFSEIINS